MVDNVVELFRVKARDLGWLGVLLCLLSAVVTVTAFIVMWRAWG